MRAYQRKVEVLASSGEHLRYLPAAVAKSMIDAGHAIVAHANGKIRAIKLTTTAATHATVIGPPSAPALASPRFVRRVRSDDHEFWWWEFHPRSTY